MKSFTFYVENDKNHKPMININTWSCYNDTDDGSTNNEILSRSVLSAKKRIPWIVPSGFTCRTFSCCLLAFHEIRFMFIYRERWRCFDWTALNASEIYVRIKSTNQLNRVLQSIALFFDNLIEKKRSKFVDGSNLVSRSFSCHWNNMYLIVFMEFYSNSFEVFSFERLNCIHGY